MRGRAMHEERRTDKSEWLRMVERLGSGEGWPADELPIEIVQTHISAVLMGRHHVLKLKKPVDFGFLDYTTLSKRLNACEAELRLNRRLCPDTYISVLPIAGELERPKLFTDGPILDYGVWMHRLPAERMLDRLLSESSVTESMIASVAERLHAFHRKAARGPEVERMGSPETIRLNWEENFAQVAPYVGRAITRKAFEHINAWVTGWLDGNNALLLERVCAGHICEGHGDVRAESICMTDPVCIFDCIEFNERFRCGDVASEVAFLAMDLDARGRPDLGYYFAQSYTELSGDENLLRLLPFYRCYRAYVRGKVLSFRLDEPESGETEKKDALARARNFFDLALRYSSPLEYPTVIAVAGLSGTGKTTIARAVAGELGLRVVSADSIRKSLFTDTNLAGYGQGPYSTEANRITYQKMFEVGRALLKQDSGVVLDATLRRASDRTLATRMAEDLGACFRIVECRLKDDMIRARLDEREVRSDGLSDATWETYLRQRSEFEPITDAPPSSHLMLNTKGSITETARVVTSWLRMEDKNL